MCECVQEFFPQLLPKAEVNIQHLECWNKDGNADSLDRWMVMPDKTNSTVRLYLSPIPTYLFRFFLGAPAWSVGAWRRGGKPAVA
jgi:hypothetical protein